MAAKKHSLSDGPVFLGLDCGGSHSVAVMADAAEKMVRRVEAGPANLQLTTDAQLQKHFQLIARSFPMPSGVGIGMAGVRDERDHGRILAAADKAWPNIPCGISHDLETALLAAGKASGEKKQAQVIVLSGTGSCCYGRTPEGKTAKVGGWGHILGDKGSGYEIGLRALKATVYYYDRDGVWSGLGRRILQTLALNEPNDLIAWVQNASKSDVAALAVEVFAAWRLGDKIATDILDGAAATLAKDALSCARRLASSKRPVQFVLAGSVLLKQPKFAGLVRREILKGWPSASIVGLETEGAWGGVELARKEWEKRGRPEQTETRERRSGTQPKTLQKTIVPEALDLSPTEQRHPKSESLDKMPLQAAIALMLQEDATIPNAILKEKEKIQRVIEWVVRAFKGGGRLFYAGAGTSGRLGVLDASECPPTFRTDPEMVQGIIAGGQTALWKAVEGAEDDLQAGTRSIEFRDISKADVVIGIAASGRTPFVWGALAEAKKRGAKTVLLCFNPHLQFQSGCKPDLVIAPRTGPEVLTGSTRLKSGTATKLILNIITTLAMVRIGKVISNLMIDLNPSNTKLRDRAVRILQQLATCDREEAEAALQKSGWVVKEAWKQLQKRRARL